MGNEMESKKFILQECQDEALNKKFGELHLKLVNEVISFCKENNIVVEEFFLHADCLDESIKFGEWHPSTDSVFELYSLGKDNEKETFLFSA